MIYDTIKWYVFVVFYYYLGLPIICQLFGWDYVSFSLMEVEFYLPMDTTYVGRLPNE